MFVVNLHNFFAFAFIVRDKLLENASIASSNFTCDLACFFPFKIDFTTNMCSTLLSTK